jgi:hypothetical protein
LNRSGLRVVILVSVAVAGAASLAFMASANHLDVTDPNDTRGPLDVRVVESNGRNRPSWKIITFSRWSRPEIFDAGYVTVLLDTRRAARPDYYILVGSRGTRLYADLWRDRESKPDYRVAKVKVWRADKKSVSVKVPLKLMIVGTQRTFYRWTVETIFTGERCTRVCFDFVPDEGAVVEPLPVPSPTPTVTTTPSPSPTD